MSQNQENEQEEIFHKKPYLKNYFLSNKKGSKPNQVYTIGKAKNGEDVLYCNSKPLASVYNPSKQAYRCIHSIKIQDNDIIVILGLGNPYIIKYLHDICPPNQIVILIDESPDLVPLLWDLVLLNFLSVPGRHIFSGEPFIDLLWNYLDGLNPDRLTGIKFIENPDSILLNKKFYTELKETIGNIFSAKMSSLLTKFEFEKLWIYNIIINTIRFNPEKMNLIQAYEGILEGIPGVIVSAGPSLRYQTHFIQQIRDKVFVMTCDTALKVLLKAGIHPDAVFTLDAQLNSIFHFLGENLITIPCIADMVTNPYLLDSLNFSKIIYSMTTRYITKPDGSLVREITAGGEYAEKYLGKIGDIQSGGSVATSAFEALRFMGVKEFFFFGQDLAYTGREIHSTGTHHNEKWITQIHRRKSLEWINESIIRKRDTKYIESVNGKLVLSDFVLELYKSWFEDSVTTLKKDNPNYRFVNFSDYGSKIHGMENLSTESIHEIFKKYKNHNYPWKKIFKSYGHSFNLKNEALNDIKRDIQLTLENIKNWKNSLNWMDEVKSWFENLPYLQKLIRKTEVYILRNKSQIPDEKKKDIYLNTLEKELLKLRRKLYPILGEFFIGKSSDSS